jgi:hypothetical protein
MEPQTVEEQAAAGILLVVTDLDGDRMRVRYPLQDKGFEAACKALAAAIMFASESFNQPSSKVMDTVLSFVDELEYCGRGN